MLFLRGGGVCVICMRKAVDLIDHHASMRLRVGCAMADGDGRHAVQLHFTDNVSKTAPRLSQK